MLKKGQTIWLVEETVAGEQTAIRIDHLGAASAHLTLGRIQVTTYTKIRLAVEYREVTKNGVTHQVLTYLVEPHSNAQSVDHLNVGDDNYRGDIHIRGNTINWKGYKFRAVDSDEGWGGDEIARLVVSR